MEDDSSRETRLANDQEQVSENCTVLMHHESENNTRALPETSKQHDRIKTCQGFNTKLISIPFSNTELENLAETIPLPESTNRSELLAPPESLPSPSTDSGLGLTVEPISSPIEQSCSKVRAFGTEADYRQLRNQTFTIDHGNSLVYAQCRLCTGLFTRVNGISDEEYSYTTATCRIHSWTSIDHRLYLRRLGLELLEKDNNGVRKKRKAERSKEKISAELRDLQKHTAQITGVSFNFQHGSGENDKSSTTLSAKSTSPTPSTRSPGYSHALPKQITPSQWKFDTGAVEVARTSPPLPTKDETGNIGVSIRNSGTTAGASNGGGAKIQPKCPIEGCDGAGHATGLFKTHYTVSGCPNTHLGKEKRGPRYQVNLTPEAARMLQLVIAEAEEKLKLKSLEDAEGEDEVSLETDEQMRIDEPLEEELDESCNGSRQTDSQIECGKPAEQEEIHKRRARTLDGSKLSDVSPGNDISGSPQLQQHAADKEEDSSGGKQSGSKGFSTKRLSKLVKDISAPKAIVDKREFLRRLNAPQAVSVLSGFAQVAIHDEHEDDQGNGRTARNSQHLEHEPINQSNGEVSHIGREKMSIRHILSLQRAAFAFPSAIRQGPGMAIARVTIVDGDVVRDPPHVDNGVANTSSPSKSHISNVLDHYKCRNHSLLQKHDIAPLDIVPWSLAQSTRHRYSTIAHPLHIRQWPSSPTSRPESTAHIHPALMGYQLSCYDHADCEENIQDVPSSRSSLKAPPYTSHCDAVGSVFKRGASLQRQAFAADAAISSPVFWGSTVFKIPERSNLGTGNPDKPEDLDLETTEELDLEQAELCAGSSRRKSESSCISAVGQVVLPHREAELTATSASPLSPAPQMESSQFQTNTEILRSPHQASTIPMPSSQSSSDAKYGTKRLYSDTVAFIPLAPRRSSYKRPPIRVLYRYKMAALDEVEGNHRFKMPSKAELAFAGVPGRPMAAATFWQRAFLEPACTLGPTLPRPTTIDGQLIMPSLPLSDPVCSSVQPSNISKLAQPRDGSKDMISPRRQEKIKLDLSCQPPQGGMKVLKSPGSGYSFPLWSDKKILSHGDTLMPPAEKTMAEHRAHIRGKYTYDGSDGVSGLRGDAQQTGMSNMPENQNLIPDQPSGLDEDEESLLDSWDKIEDYALRRQYWLECQLHDPFCRVGLPVPPQLNLAPLEHENPWSHAGLQSILMAADTIRLQEQVTSADVAVLETGIVPKYFRTWMGRRRGAPASTGRGRRRKYQRSPAEIKEALKLEAFDNTRRVVEEIFGRTSSIPSYGSTEKGLQLATASTTRRAVSGVTSSSRIAARLQTKSSTLFAESFSQNQRSGTRRTENVGSRSKTSRVVSPPSKGKKGAGGTGKKTLKLNGGANPHRIMCPIPSCGKWFETKNGLKYHLTASKDHVDLQHKTKRPLRFGKELVGHGVKVLGKDGFTWEQVEVLNFRPITDKHLIRCSDGEEIWKGLHNGNTQLLDKSVIEAFKNAQSFRAPGLDKRRMKKKSKKSSKYGGAKRQSAAALREYSEEEDDHDDDTIGNESDEHTPRSLSEKGENKELLLAPSSQRGRRLSSRMTGQKRFYAGDDEYLPASELRKSRLRG